MSAPKKVSEVKPEEKAIAKESDLTILTAAQKLDNARKYIKNLEKDLGKGHSLTLTHGYTAKYANGVIAQRSEEVLYPESE
jgi:hypothetical protein